MKWKNIYRGVLMGMSDIVPGVSGGTIAVLLGIYDQLIASINGFFTKEWREHLKFLVPLGMGVALALFTLSHLMEWLLVEHAVPTFFAFIGLIIGVLPYLFHESKAKTKFTWVHYGLLMIGIVLLILLPAAEGSGELILDRTLGIYMFLFLSGFLASAAMILPGISGSFILLIMGSYLTVINALSNLDIPVIIVVGSGIFIGLITMSKIIHYFLTHYRTATFALIIGLVIGSIYVIFPGVPVGGTMWLVSMLTFIGGLLVAYLLGKVEY